MTATSEQSAAKEPLAKRIAEPTIIGTLIVLLFVWIIGPAVSDPKPHNVPVGIVAPAEVVQQVQQGIESKASGAVDLKTYADEAAARKALHDQKVYGVLLASPTQPQLLVTGASGDVSTQMITAVFTGAAAAAGQHLTVTDTAPWPSGDSHGMIAFIVMIAVTVASLLFQVLLSVRAPELKATTWVGVAAGYAVTIGVVVAATADWTFGAFAGHLWGVAFLIALLSLAVTSTVAALQRIIGLPGIPLSILLLLPLGVATSGGPVQREFLPSFYAWLNPLMPAGAAVTGIRRTAYLGGVATGASLLLLLGWIAVAGGIAFAAWSRGGKRAAVATSAGEPVLATV